MTGEDANDVTKALAAFGGPSIRYHNFGQSALRSAAARRLPMSMVAPAAEPYEPVPLPVDAWPDVAPDPSPSWSDAPAAPVRRMPPLASRAPLAAAPDPNVAAPSVANLVPAPAVAPAVAPGVVHPDPAPAVPPPLAAMPPVPSPPPARLPTPLPPPTPARSFPTMPSPVAVPAAARSAASAWGLTPPVPPQPAGVGVRTMMPSSPLPAAGTDPAPSAAPAMAPRPPASTERRADPELAMPQPVVVDAAPPGLVLPLQAGASGGEPVESAGRPPPSLSARRTDARAMEKGHTKQVVASMSLAEVFQFLAEAPTRMPVAPTAEALNSVRS